MNRCENAVFLESEAHCHKGLFEKRQLLTILFEALHVVHLARDPPFLSIGMLSWPSSFCACPVLGNPRRNYKRIAEDEKRSTKEHVSIHPIMREATKHARWLEEPD